MHSQFKAASCASLAISISCCYGSSPGSGQQFVLESGTKAIVSAGPPASTGGSVGRDHQSITFSGKSIGLVVTTGPSSDMMSYRIQGMRSPTLIIPAGATLHILFVNTDDDMVHNLEFADNKPPFDLKPALLFPAGTHDLPPHDRNGFCAERLVIVAPSVAGNYRYVCTTSGHAAAGMFGTVVVR